MTQCSSCGGFCGRVCQREFADRALNSAVYWQNRYCDLLEIIELFCMDAEYHKRASDAINQHFQGSDTRVLTTPYISNGEIA